MEALLGYIKNATLKQILAALIILGSVLPPLTYGVWDFGTRQQWWGIGHGQQAQINYVLLKRNFIKTPTEEKVLRQEVDDLLIVRVYSNGDSVMVRNWVNGSGVPEQQMNWSPHEGVDNVNLDVGFDFVSSAYADEVVKPMNGMMLYQDQVINWVDAYHVRIRRTWQNGCQQVLVINITYGNIVAVEFNNCL